MKKAALICVTRNNAEKLQTTLNSIIQNTKPEDYDLIIIDNASSDATLGIYQQSVLADHITIVRSGKNLNWVGGINLGLEMTRGYQYVGFLNDDIEVCPNWLENFFDVLDCNPDVAAVGPLTSNMRDWQGYDHARIKYATWELPDLKGINRRNVAEMHNIIKNNGAGFTVFDSLSFFCILLRRNAVDSVGGLDDAFSKHDCGYNDDYCDRLKRFNYSVALSIKTYVSHFPGKSSLINEENKIEAFRILKSKQKELTFLHKMSECYRLSSDGLSPLIEMKSFWEPLMKVMPFHNFCAELVEKSSLFPEIESYVFNPGKKIALCTLFTSEVTPFAAESEKSILSYCLRHNYTAYIYRKAIYHGIHPTWHKPKAILNHLAKHSAMVWLDADTLILQQQSNIFELILGKNSKIFHISRDLTESSPTPYNAGVFIIKNSPWGFDLLESCDRFAVDHKPVKLWDYGSDQKVLCDLLISKDPHREFHEVYDMSVFNTDPRFVDETTFLLHFMSYPNGYRIPWMKYWNTRNLVFREEDFVKMIEPL